MTIQQLIFIGLSVVMLISALFVVTTRNLFRAALMLIVSFFCVAGFFVLLDAGFFAVAQVLVYIGAISILVIFSVMLTRGMQGMQPRNSQAVASAVVAGIIFVLTALIVGPWRFTIDLSNIIRTVTAREVGDIPWLFANQRVPDTYIADLGRAFVDLNQYALPFELASVLILLALIGAIWVARERKPAEVIEERAEIAAEEAAERAAEEAASAATPSAPETVPQGAMAANTMAVEEH
jgi:NADH-quinone oxidoreductase subunit J